MCLVALLFVLYRVLWFGNVCVVVWQRDTIFEIQKDFISGLVEDDMTQVGDTPLESIIDCL